MNLKKSILITYLVCLEFTAHGFSLVNISNYPIRVEIFGKKEQHGPLKKRGAQLDIGEAAQIIEHKKLYPGENQNGWYNIEWQPTWDKIYITAEGSSEDITAVVRKNPNSVFELDAGNLLFRGKRDVRFLKHNGVGIRKVVRNPQRYTQHRQGK